MDRCHCDGGQYTTDSTYPAFFKAQIKCYVAFKPVGVFYTAVQLFHMKKLNVNKWAGR